MFWKFVHILGNGADSSKQMEKKLIQIVVFLRLGRIYIYIYIKCWGIKINLLVNLWLQ